MSRERKRPKGAPTFVATFRIGFSPSQRRKVSARFNAGTAFGRSVGFRAPGMFETLLSRKAANAGGTVVLINPYAGRLSQRCVCGSIVKKPLSQRVHACPCGVREQRDVWSAFLARHSTGQAPDLVSARTELEHRHDVGGAPRPGGNNSRVPAASRLAPAAAGRAGGAA